MFLVPMLGSHSAPGFVSRYRFLQEFRAVAIGAPDRRNFRAASTGHTRVHTRRGKNTTNEGVFLKLCDEAEYDL